MQRGLILSAVALALLACTPAPERHKPNDERPAKLEDEQPAKPESGAGEPEPAPVLMGQLDESELASFGMPSAESAWSFAGYTSARQAMVAIAKQNPKLLPRAGSPTFARMTDIDHLRTLANAVAPDQLFGLMLSLGAIETIYGDRVPDEPEFEREQVMLSAAVLVVTSKVPDHSAATEADAAALRNEPSRLQGMLRFRHGVYEQVVDLLEPAPNSVLARGLLCEQLALAIDDAAPLLLEEERASVREQLRGCAGASTEALAKLERALASDAPSAALVSALLPEHREFKSTVAD